MTNWEAIIFACTASDMCRFFFIVRVYHLCIKPPCVPYTKPTIIQSCVCVSERNQCFASSSHNNKLFQLYLLDNRFSQYPPRFYSVTFLFMTHLPLVCGSFNSLFFGLFGCLSARHIKSHSFRKRHTDTEKKSSKDKLSIFDRQNIVYMVVCVLIFFLATFAMTNEKGNG